MLLGNKIRSLRDEQGILQRQVAAYLEIDTPMFSKIERGDRRAKRIQVIRVSGFSRLVPRLIMNKVVPLSYGTNKATTCHPSGCTYRQFRCRKL